MWWHSIGVYLFTLQHLKAFSNWWSSLHCSNQWQHLFYWVYLWSNLYWYFLTFSISSLQWNETRAAFIQPSEAETQAALQTCMPWEQCISCGKENLHQERVKWTALGHGISHLGVVYHTGDCVYLKLSVTPTGLYRIAMILELYSSPGSHSGWCGKFQLFARQDALAKESPDEGYLADEVCLIFYDH